MGGSVSVRAEIKFSEIWHHTAKIIVNYFIFMDENFSFLLIMTSFMSLELNHASEISTSFTAIICKYLRNVWGEYLLLRNEVIFSKTSIVVLEVECIIVFHKYN